MGEHWGLPGGAFLLLYVRLLNLPWITGMIMVRVWRRAGRHGEQLPGPRHLAYLTGGPVQVVETTIAALLESGKLRVNSGGLFQAASGATGDDQLEDAVLENTRRRRSPTRAGLVGSTRRSPGVLEIERYLARRGLVGAELPERRRTRMVLILQVLVLALGLGALLTSDGPENFVAILLMLILVGGGSAGGALFLQHSRRALDDVPTPAGRRLVAGSAAWPATRIRRSRPPRPRSSPPASDRRNAPSRRHRGWWRLWRRLRGRWLRRRRWRLRGLSRRR
ncbi:TIGR04222 domain-containing membrane protein [Amycolatopsis aidingensis]|uniref:TIGR04222 domain-containing membrane protein n=1 Tax=Amycolatopsis aidingensis TaxID=2842453 RepID=UPI001C0B1AA7|nr:TIGR04222 domain-containing membrane protein [Amycolatopsis aidingensis]